MSGCVVINYCSQATQVFQGAQNEGADELCGLGRFQKNNPPIFKGRYNIKGAQIWIQEIEKKFRVIICMYRHKILETTSIARD